MIKKLIAIFLTLLMISTIFVVILDDIEVEAASQEEESTYYLLGAVDEPIGLDFEYIRNKTYDLSNTIKNAYPVGALRKGRYFGSIGERYAATEILQDAMKNELGLYGPFSDPINPYLEQIENIGSGKLWSMPGVNFTEDVQVNSFGLTINNESSNESLVLTDDFHIRPIWNWKLFKFVRDVMILGVFYRLFLKSNFKLDIYDTDSYDYNMIFNNNWLTKNLSGENLKLEHKPTNHSWFSDVFDYYAEDINNNDSIVDFASFLLDFFSKFQEYYNFTFGELTPEIASEKFEWFDEEWNISDGEDFLFISEDNNLNPNPPEGWTAWTE